MGADSAPRLHDRAADEEHVGPGRRVVGIESVRGLRPCRTARHREPSEMAFNVSIERM